MTLAELAEKRVSVRQFKPEQLAALVAVGVPAAAPAGGHDRRPVETILTFIE